MTLSVDEAFKVLRICVEHMDTSHAREALTTIEAAYYEQGAEVGELTFEIARLREALKEIAALPIEDQLRGLEDGPIIARTALAKEEE